MKKDRGYKIGLAIVILIFGFFTVKNIIYRSKHDKIIKADNITGLKGVPKKTKDSNHVDFIKLYGEKARAPEFTFIDQNGDTISNKDYEGKVYVVEFFYTTCPTICPIMNENLLEISKRYKNNKKFGIASFSIDPEHDTSEVLKNYAEAHEIDHPNWHLMTGDKKSIYDLARNGYKLTAIDDPNEPGGILHDGMFALVDKNGFFRSRKDKYGNSILYYRGYIEHDAKKEDGKEEPQIKELIEDIKELLHE